MVLKKFDRWIQYNGIDFEKQTIKTAKIKAISTKGGILQIRMNSICGPLIAEVNIPDGKVWTIIPIQIVWNDKGKQNILFGLKNKARVEIDWIAID